MLRQKSNPAGRQEVDRRRAERNDEVAQEPEKRRWHPSFEGARSEEAARNRLQEALRRSAAKSGPEKRVVEVEHARDEAADDDTRPGRRALDHPIPSSVGRHFAVVYCEEVTFH